VCTPITANVSLALDHGMIIGVDWIAQDERDMCGNVGRQVQVLVQLPRLPRQKDDSTVMMTSTTHAIPNLPRNPSRPVSDLDPIFPDKSNIRHLSTWTDYSQTGSGRTSIIQNKRAGTRTGNALRSPARHRHRPSTVDIICGQVIRNGW
jgi:hypothetical protein